MKPDSTELDYVLLNTDSEYGSRCMIRSRLKKNAVDDPVLYFWDDSSTSRIGTEYAEISYETDTGTYRKTVNRDITELELFDCSGSSFGDQEIHGIYGLQNLPNLQTLRITDFKTVNIPAIQTMNEIRLVFFMCDTITHLNDLCADGSITAILIRI
jgi:hypothetical protein